MVSFYLYIFITISYFLKSHQIIWEVIIYEKRKFKKINKRGIGEIKS